MTHDKLDPGLLIRCMRRPNEAQGLNPVRLGHLARYARRANLLANLSARCRAADAVPAPLEDIFEGADMLAADHARRLRWELTELSPLVRSLDCPVVALKGAAYMALGLPSADGRLVSDLDLMVPEASLKTVERAMRATGYDTAKQDPYEQRYYREWMHELPPMIHPARGTVVDLHHTISPPVSRLKIDAPRLFERVVPLEGDTAFMRLGDEDLVLHLAVHMFHAGELDNALRELFDLDAMLRRFGADAAYWPRLVERARDLGVTRPLHYAVHFAHAGLGTPVPGDVERELRRLGPPAPLRPVVHRLMWSSLLPERGERPSPSRGLAVYLMFLRAHWLRMPPGMLVRHLWTQARRRGGLKTAEQAMVDR